MASLQAVFDTPGPPRGGAVHLGSRSDAGVAASLQQRRMSAATEAERLQAGRYISSCR